MTLLFQAKDVIRDAHYVLESRRVLFRSPRFPVAAASTKPWPCSTNSPIATPWPIFSPCPLTPACVEPSPKGTRHDRTSHRLTIATRLEQQPALAGHHPPVQRRRSGAPARHRAGGAFAGASGRGKVLEIAAHRAVRE